MQIKNRRNKIKPGLEKIQKAHLTGIWGNSAIPVSFLFISDSRFIRLKGNEFPKTLLICMPEFKPSYLFIEIQVFSLVCSEFVNDLLTMMNLS